MTDNPDKINSSLEPLEPSGGFLVGADSDLNKRVNELELECAAHETLMQGMREKLVRAEVGRCAALMGVPSEKISHVSKLVDTAGTFTENGELDTDAVGTAVGDVLKDIPELAGTRTGGAFNPKTSFTGKADSYRRQIDHANAKGNLLEAISLKRKARKQGVNI
ncbi:MAG: hypothetical protein FWE92_00035 [Defluviitaleaceae bacterium]|nr:hypothetical protein [Defluviitaleaceae bacterium]